MSQPLTDLAILRAVEECGETATMRTIEAALKTRVDVPVGFEILDHLHALVSERLLGSDIAANAPLPTYAPTAAGRARLEEE